MSVTESPADGTVWTIGHSNHPAAAFVDMLQSHAIEIVCDVRRTAVMCSEAVWWRCHRRLVADVLVSLRYAVMHIGAARRAAPHVLQPPARILRGALTYEPHST